MTAAPKNLFVEQGATYRLPFQWCAKVTNLDGSTTVTPHEIVGWTGRMQFRAKVNSAEALLSVTTEDGGITLSEEGHVAIYLTDAQTMALVVKTAVYDLELVDTAAPVPNVYRLLEGSVTIDPNVTR